MRFQEVLHPVLNEEAEVIEAYSIPGTFSCNIGIERDVMAIANWFEKPFVVRQQQLGP